MALLRGLTACLIAAPLLTCAPALAVTSEDAVAPGPTASAALGHAAAGVKVPDFATRAWVLADLDSGAILAEHNPHLRLRPASTLKLLTALTVVPRLAPDQLYRAEPSDEVADGNRVVMHSGLTYSVRDLIHAMLLPSANDAAMALAKANGGAAATVAQMNTEAARIGATDTHAVNPSGLDADGQLTSAHDLALIGREAFGNPEIAEYLKLAVVDFPGKATKGGGRVIYPIYSLNRMLRDGFDGPLGGKSGFTTLARRTFVAAAQRDGRRLLVSMMDIGGNTYRSAELLLNWGFANYAKLEPVGRLADPSAPAQVFERVAQPLPEGAPATGSAGGAGQPDQATEKQGAPAAAGPPQETGGGAGSSTGMVTPMLRALTILLALVVLARARVFWLAHRHRTGWHALAGSPSRRQAPRRADVRTKPRRTELVDTI